MKITFILPSFPSKPIGGCRVIYEYANRLVQRGYKINIVYPKKIKNSQFPPTLYKKIRKEVGYLYRILFKPRPTWQFVDSRVQQFFVPEPSQRFIPDADVVFATFWAVAEYVMEYPENKGKKCYLFQHYEIWGGPKEKVDATWKSSFYKIVVSKWLYNIGQSLGAKNMVYIPNGVDHNHFKILNPVEKRLACVSMMYSEIPWKGSKEGIQSLLLVKQKFPKLKAILFGTEKPSINIPEWIEYRRDPSQKVLVREIYNRSSIFLCSSHTEGFGLPPLEAMACGCAVVTTNCGGVGDFVENGTTALVSPVKNYLVFADNVVKLLEDDNLRIKIALNGRKRAEQFNWEVSTGLFEEFLKRITKI